MDLEGLTWKEYRKLHTIHIGQYVNNKLTYIIRKDRKLNKIYRKLEKELRYIEKSMYHSYSFNGR